MFFEIGTWGLLKFYCIIVFHWFFAPLSSILKKNFLSVQNQFFSEINSRDYLRHFCKKNHIITSLLNSDIKNYNTELDKLISVNNY